MNVYEFVTSECTRCGYAIVDGAEISVSCVPDVLCGPIAKLASDNGAVEILASIDGVPKQ